MLLDVAWPDAFGATDTQHEEHRPGTFSVDVRRFRAPDDLGEVDVALDVHTARAGDPELFEPWQRGDQEVTQARERTLVCRNGEGFSYAAELGTDLLMVTYLVQVGPRTVTLRTGRADAVVIGAAMLELDEIARTLNVRSA